MRRATQRAAPSGGPTSTVGEIATPRGCDSIDPSLRRAGPPGLESTATTINTAAQSRISLLGNGQYLLDFLACSPAGARVDPAEFARLGPQPTLSREIHHAWLPSSCLRCFPFRFNGAVPDDPVESRPCRGDSGGAAADDHLPPRQESRV